MSDTRSVEFERNLPHPAAKVWRALTEPHLMADWLMSTDFEPKLGHRFKLKADWGEVSCKVVELDPPHRLAYSWDAMGLESTVIWTLTPSGEQTMLRMVQTGFQPDQARAFAGAKVGWTRFLDNLDRLMTTFD